MKLVFLIAVLFSVSASSQKLNIDSNVYKLSYMLKHQPMKPTPLILTHLGLIGLGAGAGIAQGQNDILDNNKHAFGYRHRDLNPAWWDKEITAPRLNQDSRFRQTFLSWTQDRWHQNQSTANVLIGTQFALVGILSMDDFNRSGKVRWGRLVLYVIEANASRMIAKHFTMKYYDVF